MAQGYNCCNLWKNIHFLIFHIVQIVRAQLCNVKQNNGCECKMTSLICRNKLRGLFKRCKNQV